MRSKVLGGQKLEYFRICSLECSTRKTSFKKALRLLQINKIPIRGNHNGLPLRINDRRGKSFMVAQHDMAVPVCPLVQGSRCAPVIANFPEYKSLSVPVFLPPNSVHPDVVKPKWLGFPSAFWKHLSSESHCLGLSFRLFDAESL